MSAYALPGSFSFLDSNQRHRKETSQHDTMTDTVTTSSSEDPRTLNEKTTTTSELLVTIESATIDPLRYIQFFQKNPTYSRPRRWEHNTTIEIQKEEATDEDDYFQTVEEEDDDADDCYNYSDTFYPPEQPLNDCANSQPNHDDCSSNALGNDSTSGVEDAIHFHLSVSFCGRTYTAKRTLPSFQKLRNDLIQEIGSKTSSSSSSTTTKRSTQKQSNHCTNVSIPELPKTASTDLLGISGLSNIQEAITSFVCPAMESWLRNVAEQLPSSPSLCKFLWEPLSYVSSSKTNNTNQKKSSRFSMKSLNNSLSSIHEYYQHEEDEEEQQEESGW